MTGFQPVDGSSILLARTHMFPKKPFKGLFRLKLSVRAKQPAGSRLREESKPLPALLQKERQRVLKL